jgi:hypothetical protein
LVASKAYCSTVRGGSSGDKQASEENEHFRIKQDRAYISDLDKEIKRIKGNKP